MTSLLRVASSTTLKGYCCFTFDDNPSQDLSVVKPILDAQGIKGSFCGVTGTIGGGGSLSWANLTTLIAAGHDVVAHSLSHINLIGASAGTLTTEITNCKATFVSNGITPNAFCWPGHASDAAARTSAALSYKYALGSNNDGLGGAFVNTRASVRSDRYQISRVPIYIGGSLAGYKAYVDTAVSNKGLVIYLCHSGYDLDAATQADLNSLIDYAQGTSLVIDTVTNALRVWGYQ